MSSIKVKCLICSGERDRSACEIVVLTPEERAAIANPLDEYPYCKPCWKVMQNPSTATDLMRGIAYAHLQAGGVHTAKQLADQYKVALLSQTRKT